MSKAALLCDSCKGKKKMVGFGNLQKDCGACRGIGWIDIPDDDLKVTLGDVMKNPKRGRKKKVIENVLQC